MAVLGQSTVPPTQGRAFLADGVVGESSSRTTSYSQAYLVLGTGLGLGLLTSSINYAYLRSLPSATYHFATAFLYSLLTLFLWRSVLPRFANYSTSARLFAQSAVSIVSFAILSLIVVEAQYSVFGLGAGSFIYPYGGGDIELTISEEAIRLSPWLGVLIPVVPVTILGIVGFNQGWWRIFKLEGEQEELRAMALAAQLAALRAQLNPHFLFNSLNSIAELVRTDPEQAEECVERLAEILRFVLQQTQIDLVPLSEELRIAQSYLEIEQARFGDSLSVRLDVDPRARTVLVPGLMLQPLVENAVKHGISKKLGGGEIVIEAGLDGDELLVAVRDSGGGMTGENKPFDSGFGLRNLRERLTRRFGQRYEPVIETSLEGTAILVRIPRKVAA